MSKHLTSLLIAAALTFTGGVAFACGGDSADAPEDEATMASTSEQSSKEEVKTAKSDNKAKKAKKKKAKKAKKTSGSV